MQFVLHEVFNVSSELKKFKAYEDVDQDVINQILEEASKFASEVLQPTNQVGDLMGCTRNQDGSVTTPTGFKEAYEKYVEAGWPTLSCDSAYGGQALPQIINTALYEMLNSANQAWTMYPGLSHGAYECLHTHGTEKQKNRYLKNLVSGKWTGTMCLTEPHCGTDLGLIKAKAEKINDDEYKITGTKIFISSGEHDLAENIIHLVLARLPDAPIGTKGISLFVVPKYQTENDVLSTIRNNLECGSLEHKMGIHGNATCVMNFDGAIGTLIGEPHRGLQAMFVMMNAARLGVGMQSLGLTEVAYQNSAQYAKDRLQMRSLKGPQAPKLAADPIIVHPDVRRMLLTQRAYAEGGRAFTYWIALMIDQCTQEQDADRKKELDGLIALLTPIIKAFITDNAFEATNEGLQVFGGHGYIAEWGMEQFVRDARINMIYEGTNTIQSLDLLGRKVLGDMGAKLRKFGDIIKEFIEQEGVKKEMMEFIDPLNDLVEQVEKLTKEIGLKAMLNHEEVGAAAVPYLRIIGHLVYSYLFAKMARVALNQKGSKDTFYEAKLGVARFYFSKLLPETTSLLVLARSGSKNLMSMDEALF
jgi:alkylation response protein AidB-like acyl-CoA dehydrogenase